MFYWIFMRRNSRGRTFFKVIPNSKVFPSTLESLRARRWRAVWDSALSEKQALRYAQQHCL